MIKKILVSLKLNILMGFFLTVPLVATVLIFKFLFVITTNWVPRDYFPGLKDVLSGYPLRFLILTAILILLYLVGLLTRNIVGRRMYQMGDRILTHIPVIKSIYLSVRQISESLFTQRKTLFKRVVLIEYPRKGLHSLAFVTAKVPPSMAGHICKNKGEPCISLFVPTTPNPTSGVLILVPESEVTELNIPVGDALTFVMSAGAVAPGESGDRRPTLLDKLEVWLKHGDSTELESENASA